MRKGFVAVLFLAFCSLLIAQQSLNNNAVTKMVKAGLSDELIISIISSQPGTYDTSPDGVIALKKADVSDAVVAAIVRKASGAAQAAPVPNPTPAFAQTKKPLVSLAGVASNQRDHVAKNFADVCPSVEVTKEKPAGDFLVTMQHERFSTGWTFSTSHIMIRNADRDIIFQDHKGKVSIAVKEACTAILSAWRSAK
jgi:hypothetical protein